MERTHAAILAVAILWCLSIPATAVFGLSPLYNFFSVVCHQLPERSWRLAGRQLPVCIRCTCIYFGCLAGLIAARKPNARLFKLAVAVTAGEFLLAHVLFDSQLLRAATGALLGLTAAPIVREGIQQMFLKDDA
jgi:uncharacterized membrane protein